MVLSKKEVIPAVVLGQDKFICVYLLEAQLPHVIGFTLNRCSQLPLSSQQAKRSVLANEGFCLRNCL